MKLSTMTRITVLSMILYSPLVNAQTDEEFDLDAWTEDAINLLNSPLDQDWWDGFTENLENASETDGMDDILEATVAELGVPQAIIDLEALWPEDENMDVELSWLDGDWDFDGLIGDDDACPLLGIPGLHKNDCNDDSEQVPGMFAMIPVCPIGVEPTVTRPCMPTTDYASELLDALEESAVEWIEDHKMEIGVTACWVLGSAAILIATKSPALVKAAAGIMTGACTIAVVWIFHEHPYSDN